MRLEDLKNQAPPEKLYHYTSQEGVIGILSKKEFWASKIHYMNDSREYALALDLAKQDLTQRIGKESSKKERERIEVLREEINSIELVNICVCSFSVDGNKLSQWRGYTSGGAGFSIGFSSEELSLIAEKYEFEFFPCVYDEDVQRALVGELIEDLLATDFNTIPGYVDRSRPRTMRVLPMGGDFAKRLARLAPLLKDSSFKDEEEWRLVSSYINHKKLKHRPGSSMIIPYFPFQLERDGMFSCIKEIIIGPTPHPDLSKYSISTLLGASEVSESPKVRASKIPFRHW